MRKLAPIAGLALLAACGQGSTGNDAQAEAAVSGPHSNAAPGTYLVTTADGARQTAILAADGSYTQLVRGEITETGTWAIENDKTCFHPKGQDEARCNSDGPIGADGTYTATPDEGEPFTVRKMT